MTTSEEFARAVVTSGLLSAEELQSYWKRLPAVDRPKDSEAFAALLVQQSRLTAYQKNELLAGRGSSLVLGNYVILDKLGQGGMGMVLKAQHKRMSRIVALKVMAPAAMNSPDAVKRFHREVQAAARLTHPNIVIAYDADEANGTHFLVMEFVEGSDLSALVKKRGPLSVAKAVECIRQAALGLQFAHEQGVVHRDIKPANLLVDAKGVVKILDMGLARIEGDTSANAELTHTGAVMGTVDYMAPEQALSTKSADARSDIYSLGISLWYLLTGKAAYDGDTLMSKLLAHRDAPIPSLCTIRSEIPPALDAVFQKMVAKHAKDRFQSMSEVLLALDELQKGGDGLGKSGSIAGTGSQQFSAFLSQLESPPAKSAASRAANPTGSGSTANAASEATYLGEVLNREATGSPRQMAANRKTEIVFWKQRRNQVIAGLMAAVLIFGGIVWRSASKPATKIDETVATDQSERKTSTRTKTPELKPEPPQAAIAPFDAEKARQHQQAWANYLKTEVVRPNSLGMQMTLIPPGEFLMGSSEADVAFGLRIADESKLVGHGLKRIQAERPQRLRRIKRPFRLAAHEVTIGQFAKFVQQSGYKTHAEEFGGNSPTLFPGEVQPANLNLTWRTPGPPVTEDCPVTQIAWNDAAAFCNWLSSRENLPQCYQHDGVSWTLLPEANGYRLPTEAEWEYACRAGTSTQFWFGDDWTEHDRHGWSNTNAEDRPHPVGLRPANPFGLFDMHGNVWEWCHDWYNENWYSSSPTDNPMGPSQGVGRVFRGGGWNYAPGGSRSAFRSSNGPSDRTNYRGFRPVLSTADTPATSVGVIPR